MSIQPNTKIKTGQEVVDDFFLSLEKNKSLDTEIIKSITDLHKEGKLTTTSITNSLSKLREKNNND